MRFWSALAGLAVLSVAPAQAATCHTDHFSFIWGTDTQTHMTVKTGTSCTIHIRTHGGGMSSEAIPRQAQNGLVSSPETYAWQYAPRKGFVGKDSFVVQMTGESMSSKRSAVYSGASNLAVDVDVVR